MTELDLLDRAAGGMAVQRDLLDLSARNVAAAQASTPGHPYARLVADFTSAAAFLRKALENLPKQIHLDSTRILAQPRIDLLGSFLSQLDAEAGAALH